MNCQANDRERDREGATKERLKNMAKATIMNIKTQNKIRYSTMKNIFNRLGSGLMKGGMKRSTLLFLGFGLILE